MFSTSPNLDGIFFILTCTTDVLKLMLQMFQNVNRFGCKLFPLSQKLSYQKKCFILKTKSRT